MCHACLPLLSATVFVKDKGAWVIESQNLFLTYEGEYGIQPTAKIILIGKNKFGLLLESEHKNGVSTDREIMLLVPFKKNIAISHKQIIYYNDFNSCGWSLPCAAFTATFDFKKFRNNTFYDLKIKRFGTDNDEMQADKAVPIDEEITYRFLDGKYNQISRNALPKIRYDKE
jgi:hypothetical protein